MVNVAGRSKGCSTCRRRRVKCDENHPVCLRCQRYGLECTGPQDITFVEGKIVSSRRSKKNVVPSPGTTASENDSATPNLNPSAPLKGNESEVYICYTRQHLRRGGPVDLALDEMQLTDIDINTRSSVPPTSVNRQISHQAILSFATILFGAQQRQPSIAGKGYSMHGVALKELNQALTVPHCYTRDEVILSVATLAMLECLVPTGPKNYLKHMAGLQRIFELRGAASCSAPRSLMLLKGVRHMLLFASLRMRRASILARSEWKEILRVNCSDEDMLEQDLYDVLAGCTVLIEDRDKLLASWDSDLENSIIQRDDLKQRALSLLTYLHTWKERWDTDSRNSYTEVVQPSSGYVGEDVPFAKTTFDFSNEFAATTLMLYNTSLIYVLRILASLPLADTSTMSSQTLTQDTQQNAASSDSHEHSAAERLAALEICRCLPYYLDRNSRSHSHSCPIVHWAATTAWTSFCGNETPEGRWMMDLLNMKNRGAIAKGLWAT